MGIITTTLITNKINETILIIVLFLMAIVSLLFLLTIYSINKANLHKIALEKNKQKYEFETQKINTIKNIKNDIDHVNHKMFYIFYQTELFLKDQKYDEAHKLLETYRKYTLKYKMIIDTKNTIFDCLMSLKINDLISNNVNVNLCISISQSIFYDNFAFINEMINILDCLSQCHSIALTITENNQFSIIKLVYSTDKIVNENSILKSIETICKILQTQYIYKNNILKLSIKRED